MAGQHRLTDEVRHRAIDIALSVSPAVTISATSPPALIHHPRHNTSAGELLLDLAADAIGDSGASRQSPLEFEAIRERHLPDGLAHTKAQQHQSKCELRAAAMLHGGVDPGLLDEVPCWRTDDLWYWSPEALAVYVRAAAERTNQTVELVCRRIADAREVTLE